MRIHLALTLAGLTACAPLPEASPPPAGHHGVAFGIDYSRPLDYLAPGEQTRLSSSKPFEELRGPAPSLAHLGAIYFWIKQRFVTWPAGGRTIGAVTAEQLLAERRLGGCHDWALVYAAIARELGYPAVLVDAAGITWARRFLAGQKGQYQGHVFVEVFLDGQWLLIDATNNWYVAVGYDPTDPIIPLTTQGEPEGWFVLRKGVDTWGYGIRSNRQLTRMMEEAAQQLDLDARRRPRLVVERFAPPAAGAARSPGYPAGR